MKKLFAAASYSFDNFYNNLNTQGQMVFSLIMLLIFALCVILFIAYIIESIKNKNSIKKIKKAISFKKDKQIVEEKKVQDDSINENTSEVENIANAIKDALKEEPVSLTNFEEDQEKTAIISIDELIKKAKELELLDDEEHTGVNYLEKYNIDPSDVEVNNNAPSNIKKDAEVKAFKVSQVISPIYGVKKDVLNDKEA